MLCHICEKFRQNLDLSRAQEFPLHDRFDSLIINSKAGCALCRMIESDVHRQRAIDKINSHYGAIANSIANKGFIVSFRPPPEDGGESKSIDVDVKVIVEQLYIPDGISNVFKGLDRTEDTHTGSSSAFRIASAWLAECLKHHPYCNTIVALEAQLPTRVIDVGSVERRNDVCLLETEGRMTGNYIALSHCWGGNSHAQTTITTLPVYVSKIDLNILPKTFADAIRIARQLGIRYLWIDSLCIIQDSPNDWESEASQMGTYYKNALVTISAAHGSNSDAGLFVKRDSLSTQPCLVNIKYSNDWRQAYVYARDTSFQLSRSSLGELKKPLPLYSRSWVLQEQLLSLRTLTYGKFGISWRCQTMRFDERAPLAMKTDDFIKDKSDNVVTFRGDPREIETTMAELQRNWIFPRRSLDVIPGGAKGFQIFHKNEHCSPTSDHFMQDWGRLVQNYTSRGMTHQTDKLIAISGIASIISSSKSLEYTAGIWNGSHEMFVQGLLWSASKRGPRLLDVAPSWSWASIECEVNWPGHLGVGFRQTASIISFDCSGTAARSQGSITLQSHVRHGIIGSDGTAGLIVQTNDSGSSPNAISPHWKQGVISLDEVMPAKTPLLFLEVGTGKVNYTRTDSLVHALVLRHDDEHPRKCRRVGYSTWDESFWKKPTETASELDGMMLTIH